MANKYPRESVEVQPITVSVKVAGVEVNVNSAVEVSLTAGIGTPVVYDRPSVWVAPVIIDGELGVMVQGLVTGKWGVWARVTDSPEVPVLFCGSFVVT
jgi:hypothetical protein